MISTITPQELDSLRKRGQSIELIDVRTPAEFREMHVEYAHNIPLDRLNTVDLAKSHSEEGKPLYVICRSGGRGKQACEKLAAAGAQVFNVEGGTLACEAAGLPLVRGKKTISLERQVRIVAGLLVLVGAGLGAFVHPAWIGLVAFVGAGLFFSGVTDTCGMALLLGKMPWNQVKEQKIASACSIKQP